MRRTGVVLAGGKGERMGAYKPLVPFRGRPLVAWVVDAINPLVDDIIVAHGPPANAPLLRPHLPPHARLVADDGGGPHAGLLAAARIAAGDWILLAPSDAPRLTPAPYRALLDAAQGREGAAFVQEGHLQALLAVYRRDALLRALPQAPSVKTAAALLDLARLDATPHADALRDADTPEDLAARDG